MSTRRYVPFSFTEIREALKSDETFAPWRFVPRINKRRGFTEECGHQLGGSTLVTVGWATKKLASAISRIGSFMGHKEHQDSG